MSGKPEKCPYWSRRTPMIPWHNGMFTYRVLEADGSVSVHRVPCTGCRKVESEVQS